MSRNNDPAGAGAQNTSFTPPTPNSEPDGWFQIDGRWVPVYNLEPEDPLLNPGKYETNDKPEDNSGETRRDWT